MTSNELYCLGEQGSNQQSSIFNQLLEHYSNPQIHVMNSQQKLFAIHEWAEQQQEAKGCHKNSGQWVWADHDEFSNQYQNQPNYFKQQTLTTDNFELRRVKSLRIQQQDKITMFLKKQTALSILSETLEEQKEEPTTTQRSPQKRSTLTNKSQSLSPKKCKSKKIDKFKMFKLMFD